MNFDRLLVKAKRVESDEWVIGFYIGKINHNHKVRIGKEIVCTGLSMCGINLINTTLSVDFETISQCTGLKDDNGRLIFEGDICRVSMGEYYMGVWEYSSECECRWCATGFDFVNDNGCGNASGFASDPEEIIIVGNIHDKGAKSNE